MIMEKDSWERLKPLYIKILLDAKAEFFLKISVTDQSCHTRVTKYKWKD